MLAWFRKPEYCFRNKLLTRRLGSSIRQLQRRSYLRSHVLPEGTEHRKEKTTFNTWHMCNAQYVCMNSLMHFVEALNMLDKFLGFVWQLCNYDEINPEMDPGGHFGQF